LVGWVKTLMITTGIPAAQASQHWQLPQIRRAQGAGNLGGYRWEFSIDLPIIDSFTPCGDRFRSPRLRWASYRP